MANFKISELLLCFILIAVPIHAVDHTVGDAAGWALGVDYTTWATGKTFTVGDNLVFKFASSHTVDEVTSSDYSACSSANSISSDSSGSTTVALKTPGTHYFVCGTVGHCSGGMKLSVPVVAAGGSTTSPPSGSGTGGGSTTTPTGPATGSPPAAPTTPTPTPASSDSKPSSSVALSPFVALLFSFGAVMTKLVFF